MSERMVKRQIPMVIAFVVGILMMADWYVDWGPIEATTKIILNFQIILVAALIGHGFINLFPIQIERIKRNLSDKKYYDVFCSFVLLGTLVLFAGVGIGFGSQSEQYRALYSLFATPLWAGAGGSTLYFLAAATYRLLRPKSRETTILFVVAFITIMSNMPVVITYFPILIGIKSWIVNTLVKSSYRAITIGVGLGGVMIGIRVLLGLETKYLGVQAEDE